MLDRTIAISVKDFGVEVKYFAALQTRLMDVAADTQTLADALSHSTSLTRSDPGWGLSIAADHG